MSEPAGDEISLHDLLEVLLKGKWIILACFLTVLTLVALYTFTQDPVYEASSTLLVNTQQSTAPQLGELIGLPDKQNVANEIEILRSRRISMQVAEEILAAGTIPGTRQPFTMLWPKDDGTPLTSLDVAGRLRGGYLEVRTVSDDVDMIDLRVTSTVPAEARFVANAYAREYVEYNTTSSRSRMTASRAFLDTVTANFERGLRTAEDELTQFFNREMVVAPDVEAQTLLEQISLLQQLQYQTQADLGRAQAEVRALENELEGLRPGLAEAIRADDDLMIDQLRQAIATLQIEEGLIYAKRPELRGQPGPPEGRLAEIQREIEELTAQLSERIDRLVASADTLRMLGSSPLAAAPSAAQKLQPLQELRQRIAAKTIELSGLQARLSIVNDELGQYESQLQDIPNQAIIMRRLERAKQTQEELYLTLLVKLHEAEIAEQSELGYIEVIDEAILPTDPVKPRIPLNLMLGAMLGLGLGIGIAFARSAFDNRIHKPEDLRRLGFSVLGVIPDMERVIRADFEGRERVAIDGASYDTRLISLLNPLSPVAESYRRLRTNIQFSRPDSRAQVILVTSSGPGEGKSVTTLNLAVTMAQSGRKTLVLDADLRRSTIYRMVGLPRDPGLVDLLFDTVVNGFARFKTTIEDLYVVPTGRSVPNPSEVLGSQKMKDLIGRARQEFDVVIIDTPPVLAVTDALLLVSECDVPVVVSSAEETHQEALVRTAEALRDVGAEPAGIVLNRFDAKASYGGYGYGYGYGYYDYYGERPHAEPHA